MPFLAKTFQYASFQTTEKDVLLKDLKIDIQIFNEKLERIDEMQKKSVISFLKSSDLVKWMKNTLAGIFFLLCSVFLEKNLIHAV